ncbi:MAG: hypothetical protein AUJ97_08795 [Bacteroidetes bacterium CG2_30_32_10]|nr:MAG: hypothetical protein AUJ97_08795 [Bacteroidetes bacterium CG2_30_32_10]
MIINRINVFVNFIIILTLLFVKSYSYAQYYDIGQDPANTSWNQISTSHFKIIFPKQYEKQAQYLANYIERIYAKSTKTLVSKPKNIPIILHTQSVISNAYTIWAPKRMEFFTIPPQDSYGQEWLQQLAIHEFRHVIQINKINQSKTKILYYLLGEQSTAAILGLHIPAWFMEGDAVCTETGLSKSGRGRLPSFEMEIKTQTLDKKRYPYDKAVFGSYKDFIPNQYVLGYQLTAFARKKYNANIWNKILDDVSRHPLGITSFSKSIKKQTGLNKSQFYYNTINELDSLWKKQQSSIKLTTNTELCPPNKNYINYKHPHYINDSTIIAVKTGIDDITRFITIDKQKKEKIIFTPGYFFPETFSVVDSTLIWAEVTFDLRWENRKYSTIKTFNLQTGKCKSISKNKYLFAPSLSDDKKLIVAIKNTPIGENSIVILENKTGNVIKKIINTNNSSFVTPLWNNDDNKIVFIEVSNEGKRIVTYNTITNQFTTITPYSYEEISMPKFYENFIIYNAAYSGIDNIYAIDTISKQKYQITSALYGAENACISPNKESIAYSEYTAKGFKLVEATIDSTKWIKFDTITNTSIKLYETIANQEEIIKEDTVFADSTYITKKYSKTKNLFHFHSWAPLCINAENASISPGVSILSQNILSTAFTSIGYKYNRIEKTGTHFINFTYKGLYPIIDFKISNGDRASSYLTVNNEDIHFTWNETKVITGINVPFNISKGLFYRLIEPKINISNTFIQHNKSTPANYISGAIHIMEYSIFFYNQIKSAEKDMRPRWGQTVELKYYNTPFKGLNLGEIYAISSNFNLPGIIKHHSLKLSIGFQNKNYGTYTYSDIIAFPRGLTSIKNQKMKTLFVNYKLPLAYPDFSIPNIIYIKRIKANLFYDYAVFINNSKSNTYKSIGTEVTMDFHLFRFIAPIDAGLRFIYAPDKKQISTELMYQIKFDNL